MLFFRTISLVAALAFATLTSAVPVEAAGLASAEVFARDASGLSFPAKRSTTLSGAIGNCASNVQSIVIQISQYIYYFTAVHSKLNIFTEVSVEDENYNDCPSLLDNIYSEIDQLIEVLEAGVELDISAEVCANELFNLVQVRHCF